MFGCVPIMLNSSHLLRYKRGHSLPLEEVLPWHRFSTLVDVHDLASLDKQLQCLTPMLPQVGSGRVRKLGGRLGWSAVPAGASPQKERLPSCCFW